MREVWKYPLYLSPTQFIGVPEGAELLHVAEQRGVLCLWARVNPRAPDVSRRILIRGTGTSDALEAEPHVGTVQMADFVWHVFDGGE